MDQEQEALALLKRVEAAAKELRNLTGIPEPRQPLLAPKKSKPNKDKARLLLNPLANASHALMQLKGIDEEALLEMTQALGEDAAAVVNGDTGKLEQILYAHVTVLDAVFYSLMANFRSQSDSEAQDLLLNWALRIQDQSRKTIDTLLAAKSPRHSATFVKNQLNQIVADLIPPSQLEPARYAKTMDNRTESASGTDDPGLEPVGEIKWPD